MKSNNNKKTLVYDITFRTTEKGFNFLKMYSEIGELLQTKTIKND